MKHYVCEDCFKKLQQYCQENKEVDTIQKI
jgi:hypothetical protein